MHQADHTNTRRSVIEAQLKAAEKSFRSGGQDRSTPELQQVNVANIMIDNQKGQSQEAIHGVEMFAQPTLSARSRSSSKIVTANQDQSNNNYNTFGSGTNSL